MNKQGPWLEMVEIVECINSLQVIFFFKYTFLLNWFFFRPAEVQPQVTQANQAKGTKGKKGRR